MSIDTHAPTAARTHPRLRFVRGLLTVAILLVGLGGVARWHWSGRPETRVPSDWAGVWTGDRALGLGERYLPEFRGARLVTLDGDVAYQSDGQPNRDEFMNLGGWSVGPVWTLAGWFRLESYPAGEATWASLAGGMRDGDWMIGVQGRHPAVTIGPVTNKFRLVADSEFELNRWTHVVAAGSPTRLRLYVDGRLAATHDLPAGSPPTILPGGFLHFIGAGGGEARFLRQVDDYAVFARNLAPSEIAAMHAVGRHGLLSSRELNRAAARWNARALAGAAGGLGCLWLVPWLIHRWRLRHRTGSNVVAKFAGVAVVLIVGLASTLVAGKLSSTWITASARHRFEAEAQRVHQELDSYFERVVGVMLLVREGAKSGTYSSREDWERLVGNVPFSGDFPAVTFIGIAERMEITERSAREARWKREYGQGFEIHPNLPPQQRHPDLGELTNAFLPLIYVRPQGEPVAALDPLHGLDLVAIPSGAALEAALAHQIGSALGRLPQSLYPVTLVCPGVPADTGPRLPVAIRMQWQDNVPTSSQRLGSLICAVDIARLFAEAFAKSPPEFGLQMTLTLPDGGVPVTIYGTSQTWAETAPSSAPWLRTIDTVMLYRNRLRCEFWSTPKFDRANYRHAWWLVIAAGTGFTLLAAGFVALQVRARLIQTKIAEQLGASNRQLAAAARERARLSRDLHDGTIQNLYALGLELGHARSLIAERPAEADQELGRTLTTLQAAIMELRQFVLELEPEAWQGQSVRTALEALVARLRRTTPLQFHLAIAADTDELPPKVAIHVLQLVRESLSNALRHAGATNVWVTLERTDPELVTPREWRLEIRDDGKGFEAAPTSNGGRGLRNFRERATELGGRSEVRSAPDEGTSVIVTFPSPAKP